ncbi:MAG: helix-turn-helix domain-containing protein [Candidatus Omnitrophota bacterium]
MIKLLISDEEFLEREDGADLYRYILAKLEKPLIEHTLERTAGNQIKAARILGINRNTIRAKIKKLGINPMEYKKIAFGDDFL